MIKLDSRYNFMGHISNLSKMHW